MSDQDNGQVSTLQRPTTNDQEAWKAYWKAQGQSWRTEPEIDAERQKYLTERRAIVPAIEQGIYSFGGIKLNRADVEWLLATHENGRGPVDWNDENQRERMGLDVRGVDLQEVDLSNLPLARLRAGLNEKEWHKASAQQIRAASVSFREANLSGTHLEEAELGRVHLEGGDLFKAHLDGADLRSAFFDATSTLRDATLGEAHRFVSVADIRWGGVNLAVVKWPQEKRAKTLILGDEHKARRHKTSEGIIKDKEIQLTEYERAVRANRQLANTLRGQGLSELADHFAYRAQKLQHIVLRRQKKFRQYILSGFLDLLAGYGYHPLRTLFWYAFTICTFALAYHYVWATYQLEHITKHPLSYVGAVVFSITAFHGRGFFLGGDFGYDSLITILAAIEAVIGLIIEFSFIATFTQRFFGR